MNLQSFLGSNSYWQLRSAGAFMCVTSIALLIFSGMTYISISNIWAIPCVIVFVIKIIEGLGKVPYEFEPPSHAFHPLSNETPLQAYSNSVKRAFLHIDSKYISNTHVLILLKSIHKIPHATTAGVKLPIIGGVETIYMSMELLGALSIREIAAVLAHELGHIFYKDNLRYHLLCMLIPAMEVMGLAIIYMSLFQIILIGVQNLLTIFVIFQQLLFVCLGFCIYHYSEYVFKNLIQWTRRQQEFAADSFGAKLVGVENMRAVFLTIQKLDDEHMKNMGLYQEEANAIYKCAYHPTWDERISAIDSYKP